MARRARATEEADVVAVHVRGAPVEALVLRVADEPQARLVRSAMSVRARCSPDRVTGRNDGLAVLERELRKGAPGGIVDLRSLQLLAHIAGQSCGSSGSS